MTAFKGTVIVATFVVAAAAGLWVYRAELLKISADLAPAKTVQPGSGSGPVIYYKDPDGQPLYSVAPKSTNDGRPYVAVHAGDDIAFGSAGKKASDDEASDPSNKPRKIRFYRNPMGLPDTSPVPKKDSMGMDYIPVYEGDNNDDNSIKISPAKIQRAGVQTAAVTKRIVTRTIAAPGIVQLDEQRIVVVAPRFDGYVVKIGAATTGTRVKQGDLLATVFGQELLNWGARLIIEQGRASVASDSSGIIGANRRLQNLGAPQEFVDDIKRTHRVPDDIPFRAPINGVVLERNVVDGQAFKAGDVLFRLADLSVMWIMADVAEGDIDAVRPGEQVRVQMRAYPGRVFEGRVTVVYPQLVKETRTARVRIELPNPGLALLQDMYGNVEIATGSGVTLAVPASAVIDSGRRQIVLLDLGDGRFEPRDVKLGRRGDDFIELLSGVSEGDRVVANGNFLLDAESNLEAALKSLSEPPVATEARQ